MADKYIVHGAPFNGDGSSASIATADGGVGAWNNINILEGTTPAYGSLVAGDTVFIRSKDYSDSSIIRTVTANLSLGSAAATITLPIVWVVDNGNKWAGVSGTITYTHAAAWTLTSRLHNHIVSSDDGQVVVRNTSANQAAGAVMLNVLGRIDKLTLDWSAKTGTGECVAVMLGDDAILDSPTIQWGRLGGNVSDGRGLIRMTNNTVRKATIIGPKIVLNNINVGLPIFYSGDNGRGLLSVIGGSITGPGATSGQVLYRASLAQARFRSVGLRFPRTLDVTLPNLVGFITSPGEVEIIGCDSEIGGHLEKEWGFATSRSDLNPPTLQATIPDSAGTKWSWRVYPKAPSSIDPVYLSGSKLYTGELNSRQVVQELLVADTMTATKWNTWITVEYCDQDGNMIHVSSRDALAQALDTSTANWSATVWGAVSFTKRKLHVTTPTSVLPNSLITVTVWSTLAAASANDIMFVDPDFGVL